MQPAPGANEVPRLDGLSVLVVDDMAEVRHLLISVLRRQGARGILAASAAAVLEALERERPDVDSGSHISAGAQFLQRRDEVL